MPALLVVSACGTSSTDELGADTSLYAVVETIDGTSFHPPLGPAPAVTGTFDASLLARLAVVLEATDGAGVTREVARFDAGSSRPLRLFDKFEAYMVNVPAAEYFTNPALSYRFRTLLDGRSIGYSDLSHVVFDVMARVPGLMVGVKLRIESRSAPTIAAISPERVARGSGELALTVTGNHFKSDSVVRFGDRELATTRVSATVLVATVPANLTVAPGNYLVSVATPAPGGGTSASATLTAYDPTPVLTSIAPTTAFAGSADLTLTVTGRYFVAGTVVRLGDVALATTIQSEELVTATIPAALLSAAGAWDVRVTTPAGTTAAATFTITRPPVEPILTGISPTTGTAGSNTFTLTLEGAEFTTSSYATFGGANLTTTYLSPTRLTAVVPPGLFTNPGAYGVLVVTPGAGNSAEHTFTASPGGSVPGSGTSCQAIKTAAPHAPSGVYTIIPATGPNYQAYCDMTTDGGGWSTIFAGLNGSANVFDHLESGYHSGTCTDPATRCMRRAPTTIDPVNTDLLVSCGTAAVKFKITAPVYTLITGGVGSGWQLMGTPITAVGGNVTNLPDYIWTGSGSNNSFIFSRGTAYATTFAASYNENTSWDYCNSVRDATSPVRLMYRSNNPVPALQGITPYEIIPGSAEFQLTVNGRNFQTGSIVYFGGVPLQTNFVSWSQLVATVPARLVANVGLVSVLVETGAPGGGRSGALTFGIGTNPVPASGTSCYEIKGVAPNAPSGVYTINTPSGGSAPAYCDMVTDGGGWTGIFAGTNGQRNVFDRFDAGLYGATCTNGASRCIRRPPTSLDPNLTDYLVSCGDAAVKFSSTQAIHNFFTAGTQQSWIAIPQPVTVVAGSVPYAPTHLWTGSGSNYSFIVSNQTASQSFASSYSPNASWDYCNGASDNTSTVRIMYRFRNPVPVLTSIAPLGTAITASDVAVTITGSNFLASSFVTMGARVLPTAFVSSTELRATVPASQLGAVATHTLSVVTPAPGGGTTLGVSFVVGASAPPATIASCLAMKNAVPTAASGTYVLTSAAGARAATYCDMTTDGGGWTALLIGENGSPNVFDHFDSAYHVGVCTDPATECLRRAPAGLPTASTYLLVQCGAAAVKFPLTTALSNYLSAGTQQAWLPIGPATVVTGTVRYLPTYLWTGSGSNRGWILGNQTYAQTFASSYIYNGTWDYCNGALDTSSPLRMYYR
ncbi:hypothetical protein L6R52_07475 [Myxococcota bacterium]|nr:hypothetical protein [Myxococcota bacterium]